ncbi:hypothetical protein DY000_02022559 [Brassica cretica]|uniref:Uncharacterized protein n=1 Tax=Brassica cretica TaxID=69181 RepID=A0ABQ7E8I8_BRACR|nr:hypothetical protein DY000_02022559 [Brassica cretica]
METEAARFRKLPQGSDSDSDSDSEAGSGRPMKLPCNVEEEEEEEEEDQESQILKRAVLVHALQGRDIIARAKKACFYQKLCLHGQMHTPTNFMYCGMISTVVGGIIPIYPYTIVDDKALTAENLNVLGTPAREIIKVHPLLSMCEIQAKATKI